MRNMKRGNKGRIEYGIDEIKQVFPDGQVSR